MFYTICRSTKVKLEPCDASTEVKMETCTAYGQVSKEQSVSHYESVHNDQNIYDN